MKTVWGRLKYNLVDNTEMHLRQCECEIGPYENSCKIALSQKLIIDNNNECTHERLLRIDFIDYMFFIDIGVDDSGVVYANNIRIGNVIE